jgi:teichuronic acid biosynthesis glycosyltransferase TuaG
MADYDPSLVSVITPAYRAARFLPETVASVQAQSWQNWEMVVAEDCSSDDTRDILLALAAREPRLKPILQPRNQGPAAARNAALAAARGRFIAFLDADDLWLPQKLERQLAFMRETGAAFSFTCYRRISADGSQIGHLIRIPNRLDYRDLLKNTAIATSSVIIDRATTGPLSMTCTYYDDYALWLSLTKRGHVAYGLQEDLMRYRVVNNSVSRNKWRSAYWVWRLYRDIEGLSLTKSSWCFAHYALNGVLKYHRF